MKICNVCNLELNETSFNKAKKNKDGLKKRCKKCQKEWSRKYNQLPEVKERTRERQKEYRKTDKYRAYAKAYSQSPNGKACYKKYRQSIKGKESVKKYRKNSEHYKNYNKEYARLPERKERTKELRQKDSYKEQIKKYHQSDAYKKSVNSVNNKERVKKYNKEYSKKRSIEDIDFKLRMLLRSRMGKAIRRNQKAGSSVNDLGCSVGELKIYLENKFEKGMNWNNQGEWHIDHIKPLSKFNLQDRNQFLEACNYTNLQPLWAKDNINKSNF